MKENIKVISILIIVLWGLFGLYKFYFGNHTPVETALQTAGTNTKELEKVLMRYRQEKDTLKYNAACFLISNMPYHSYYEGEKLREAEKFFELLRQRPDEKHHIGDSIKLHINPYSDLSIERDITTLDSAYICHNIDWAFKVWREQPWGKNISFSMFCESILPYRIGNEKPEYWREEYYNTYNSILDDFRNSDSLDVEDPIEALKFILPKLPVYNPIFTLAQPFPFPHIGPQKVCYFSGTCREFSDFMIYVCRSIGIPCAFNFTISSQKINGGHFWSSYWDKYENEYAIADFPPTLCPNHQNYLMAMDKIKVYRETFAVNSRRLKTSVKSTYKPVDFFRLPTFKDVTSTYTNKFLSEFAFPADSLKRKVRKHDIVYLCSSNKMSWIAEDITRHAGQHIILDSIQTDELMCLSINKGNTMVPITEPFTINSIFGNLHFFSGNRKYIGMTLKAKFTKAADESFFCEQMKGAVIEASQTHDFKNSDTLYLINAAPDRRTTIIKTASRSKYRYVRYRCKDGSACMLSDLRFYDADMNQLNGKPFGKSGNADYYKVFDNNDLTSYHSDIPNDWCGLRFNNPVNISHISYTPRNRDNYVKPGDTYELFYYDNDWHSSGVMTAHSDTLRYDSIPQNRIYLLKNLTSGTQERIFTYFENRQIWK